MAEFNSRFATVSEEEIVEIEEKAIPEVIIQFLASRIL